MKITIDTDLPVIANAVVNAVVTERNKLRESGIKHYLFGVNVEFSDDELKSVSYIISALDSLEHIAATEVKE